MPLRPLLNLNSHLHRFFRFPQLQSESWGVAFELSTFIHRSERQRIYKKFHSETAKHIVVPPSSSPQRWDIMPPAIQARKQTTLARLEDIAKDIPHFHTTLLPRQQVISSILKAGGQVCITQRASNYVFFPQLLLQTLGLSSTEIAQISVFTNEWCSINNDALNQAIAHYGIQPKNLLTIDDDPHRVLVAQHAGFPVYEPISQELENQKIGEWIEKYRVISAPLENTLSYS